MLKNKLKKIAGMTLMEMLVCVLLLLIASGGMAGGVALASRQYNESLRKSEAEQLYTTLETIITEELRYTSSATTEGSTTVFKSKKFPSGGMDTILIEKGEVYIGNTTTNYAVVNSKSYSRGLKVALDRFTLNGNVFTVQLTISANDKEYATGTFQVRGLSL